MAETLDSQTYIERLEASIDNSEGCEDELVQVANILVGMSGVSAYMSRLWLDVEEKEKLWNKAYPNYWDRAYAIAWHTKYRLPSHFYNTMWWILEDLSYIMLHYGSKSTWCNLNEALDV